MSRLCPKSSITTIKTEYLCNGVTRKDRFIWIIENLKINQNSIIMIPSCSISSIFYTGKKQENKWIVSIRSQRPQRRLNNFIVFTLRHENDNVNKIDEDNDSNIPIPTLMKIESKKNDEIKIETKASILNLKKRNNTDDSLLYECSLPQLTLQSFISQNDSLEILIEIQDSNEDPTTCSIIKSIEFSEYLLPQRLSKFIFNNKYSDIIIDINGTELKSHKILLAIQSSVFATMIDNNIDNRIIINDMDIDIAKQMMEFIYTNKKPTKIDKYADKLIAIGHKYKMDKLKNMCEDVLFKKITIDNSIKTLIIIDSYGTKKIKDLIIEYICKNLIILQSNDFKELKKNNSLLAMKVYDQAVMKI
ncbi:hypothetical protein HCN44_005287 [Aphidius gifuensis]|uniref:BTB domain-containing protein n=1 Tax=Aphidius gifuensis TaxID=684658 RepID=A0A835CXV5_APHGI|nr:hypothetical protein HCN44_005287 [Aphidius gifuensis]